MIALSLTRVRHALPFSVKGVHMYSCGECARSLYITEKTVVYDDEATQWGYFRGLNWVEMKETEGESSKKCKKK